MLSKFSVKKPYTVIVAVILVIVLGVISFANMTTDLLPNMDLPYVAVYTTYIGATPEQVESDVTRPMEASFATLPGIDSINSTSSENLSLVIMEFESGVDMNSAAFRELYSLAPNDRFHLNAQGMERLARRLEPLLAGLLADAPAEQA